MSYFAEVTHTECVNRMIAIKDSVQERSRQELDILGKLDALKAQYFAAGGKVEVKTAFEMQDPYSEEGRQLRKDVLRQYDRHREIEQMKADKRAGK